MSEQTFELRIQITTILSGVGQRATRGEDFEIGGVIGSIVVLQMRPEENSISFTYLIQDDPTPENQEVFQLFVTPNPGSPAFSCDIYNGCYLRVEVVIIDDDGEFYFFLMESCSGVARTSPLLGHIMGTLRLYELLRKVQKLMEGLGASSPQKFRKSTASQVGSEAIYRSEV